MAFVELVVTWSIEKHEQKSNYDSHDSKHGVPWYPKHAKFDFDLIIKLWRFKLVKKYTGPVMLLPSTIWRSAPMILFMFLIKFRLANAT